ncbi:MAG: AbrB/MazE/SpoVT family DNA-binding domain-containing protein [Candidatus Aenigmarchaeota archaeon]|nr:AbrB/MazE/SpoVT family DNA-binding domain-containing protein [Candidatus Aenigmarchaeota archaeon]
METITRTRKVGGSLVITIPKEIVHEEDLREGQLVRIDIQRPKKSGFGIFRGMKSFSEEDEMKAHD